MQFTVIEGIVKNGQIQLTEDIKLPESAKVYVAAPKLERRTVKILSPGSANKAGAKKFVKTVGEDVDDEG